MRTSFILLEFKAVAFIMLVLSPACTNKSAFVSSRPEVQPTPNAQVAAAPQNEPNALSAACPGHNSTSFRNLPQVPAQLMAPSLSLPVQAAPGTYDLSMTPPLAQGLSDKPVRALLYIPTNGAPVTQRHLLVFFHGSSTKEQEYITGAGTQAMTAFANERGINLLAIQNFVAPNGVVLYERERSHAAAAMVEYFLKIGLVRRTHVYVSGFSAGGYAALFSLGFRPDLYRGFISFHGNIDMDSFDSGRFARHSWCSKLPDISAINHGQHAAALFIEGGKDTPRVKSQYLEYLPQIKPMIKFFEHSLFPNEGHAVYKADKDIAFEFMQRYSATGL